MNHHGICASVLVLATLAGSMAGCGATPNKHTPDDPDSIKIHCNQSTLRWDACYDMAANVCGKKGYQIVAEDDSAMPTTTANANEVAVIGGSLVIRCNK